MTNEQILARVAGKIAYENGQWNYTDAYGQQIKSASPSTISVLLAYLKLPKRRTMQLLKAQAR